MKRFNQILGALFVLFGVFLGLTPHAFANNLRITNVSLEDRDAAGDTAIVEFDITWDNSWRNATNHDAVWLFLKVTSSGTTYHGYMKASGLNPADTSPGSNKDLDIYVPTDKTGAFIRRRGSGTGTVISKDVRLKLDYASSVSGALSVADTATIQAKVIGIEMVFVPTGPFYVGDTSSTANTWTLKQGSSDTEPWYISSEATIQATTYTSNGYYYTTTSQTYEDATGSTFTIPQAFPKGYAAFYAMKYEATEGQWVDFIQTLPSLARSNRDITANAPTYGGKNTDTVNARNTICQSTSSCTGIYGDSSISSNRPDRALGWVDWRDSTAYLDWAGLRPMTELEFEKLARGPLTPVPNEYAWGSTSITPAVTFSVSPESGEETIVTANANAVYNSSTFSMGDSGAGATTGPMRVGIFATGSSTRATSGAGYYGAMELSGNLEERVITIGNSDGRSFTGNHGDGILGTYGSAEGNANVSKWPHTDTQNSAIGVSKAGGTGRKGMSYSFTGTLGMSISSREYTVNQQDARNAAFSIRGVRTYDGP